MLHRECGKKQHLKHLRDTCKSFCSRWAVQIINIHTFIYIYTSKLVTSIANIHTYSYIFTFPYLKTFVLSNLCKIASDNTVHSPIHHCVIHSTSHSSRRLCLTRSDHGLFVTALIAGRPSMASSYYCWQLFQYSILGDVRAS